MPQHGPVILHVDVDAFFASVEQLLIPALRNRPVIVGSGCIASCSYEARRFGLRAGMPLRRAMQLCPSAVLLRGQYQIYRCFAEHIWHLCRRYATNLETYLDEAYGDATGSGDLQATGPLMLGRRLQRDVRDEVHLPVSVGLGANRMLAKIASSCGKPGGVVWIRPGEEEAFLDAMPVRSLPGVGHKTADVLNDMNIKKVRDLRLLSRQSLRTIFGRRGEVLYERCRGRDVQAVRPAAAPKTISRETTFRRPTDDPAKIHGMLHYLLERAMRTARQIDLLAGTVELTVHYDDWKQYDARRTLPEPTDDDGVAFHTAIALLQRVHHRRVALRHVGIVLSNFCTKGSRATLFDTDARARRGELYGTIDTIRDRWGHAAIVTGRSIELLGRIQQDDYGFVLRTPCLTK
jgi:DNA polymerase-4